MDDFESNNESPGLPEKLSKVTIKYQNTKYQSHDKNYDFGILYNNSKTGKTLYLKLENIEEFIESTMAAEQQYFLFKEPTMQ